MYTDTQTDRQTHTYSQTHRQTDPHIQTDTQTDVHTTHTHIQLDNPPIKMPPDKVMYLFLRLSVEILELMHCTVGDRERGDYIIAHDYMT